MRSEVGSSALPSDSYSAAVQGGMSHQTLPPHRTSYMLLYHYTYTTIRHSHRTSYNMLLYHYTYTTIRLTLAWSRVVGKLSSTHELPLGRHLGGDRISVMDQSDLVGIKVI